MTHMLGSGEESHDYELVHLWYATDPEYRGPGVRNMDLSLKYRCRNCGRIVPIDPAEVATVLSDFTSGTIRGGGSIDLDSLTEAIPHYTLPKGIGPFSVRYIYDDGSMLVIPLGSKKSKVLKASSELDSGPSAGRLGA